MIRQGILETARAIGANPLDLATVISYETGGTFDPLQRGPTTQWGQHRGLIQFGEPQARQYGVDWNDPIGSQLGPDGAVARYLRASGYQPGMGLLDLYSTINAGAPGRYGASDANNGGAPGTVRDKVEQQMAGHRARAAQLLGMEGGDMQGLLGSQQQPAAQARPAQGERERWYKDPAVWEALALGFNSMRLNPDDSLAPMISQQRERRGEQERRNETVEWLNGLGRPDLAEAFQRGAISPSDLYRAMQPAEAPGPQSPQGRLEADYRAGLVSEEAYRAQLAQLGGDGPRVGAQQILYDGTTIQSLSDGSLRVTSPTGEQLQGQAAADAIRAAREFEADSQRDIYGARREGTLGADIDMGGQAAAATSAGSALGTATVNAGVAAYEGAEQMQASIGNIDEAIAAIDRGADSGLIYNMLPRVSEAGASLQNAMDRMGLDVIGAVTFGALSEGEMRLAMSTAVPRGLSPPDLRAWLVRRRNAQIAAAETLANAAEYLTTPGNTINGWITQNRQRRQGADDPPAAPPAAPPSSGGRLRFNPETGEFE